ncbi:MAG: chemotaxis protein CheW [Desulfovibrionaceae bacterium]
MSMETDKNLVEEELFDEDSEDTQKDKYLTFQIGDEDYGIEIRHVTEIIGIQKITEVPDMPAFVKGVINLRGQVIPVMDVRTRFHMEPREYDDRTCVIVVRINESAIGMVVDTVNEVADIPEDAVSPPPMVSKGEGSRYLQGMGKIGGEVKILLDVNRLLHDEDLTRIAAAAG